MELNKSTLCNKIKTTLIINKFKISIDFFVMIWYYIYIQMSHHSIRVSTLASHAGNAGSNPAGGTKKFELYSSFFYFLYKIKNISCYYFKLVVKTN